MNETASPPRGVLGTKIPSSVCFAIGVILFLLPFAEFKCTSSDKDSGLLNLSSMNFSISNSGLGLALGLNWKVNSPFGDFGGNGKENWKKDLESPKPNTYALVAFILAIIGVALSFTRARAWALVNSAVGVLAAAALIGLMMDLKNKSGDMASDMQRTGDTVGSGNPAAIHLVFTPWFYISIAALIIASFFSYKRSQLIK